MIEDPKPTIDYGAAADFADDAPDYHAEPSITVDHGRQPRRPKRPAEEIWKRDSLNRYRPTRLEFDEPDEPLTHLRERKIARLLTNTARSHAPRLSWRDDAAIYDIIEREKIIANARWIAASLPPEVVDRVIEKFVTVLWDEIRFFRKRRKITKS